MGERTVVQRVKAVVKTGNKLQKRKTTKRKQQNNGKLVIVAVLFTLKMN